MAKRGPPPRVSPEDVLEVFSDREDPSEPLTAPEIADVLNCSRRTALERLHDLEERGELESKKVGGRAIVWWVPNTAGDDGAAPAAPLRDIVGLLDGRAADEARERSREWREAFDQEMHPTEDA